MKYMTFNSSCSFAGVANMLAQYGVDTDDRTIALGMKLPFLFAKEAGTYLAGPMLQSAEWFNLYLHTIGYTMKEDLVTREAALDALRQAKCAMIGLRICEHNKHAVVFTGNDNGAFSFINNKWEHSDEPERLELTEQELLSRLDEQVAVATLVPVPAEPADFEPLYRQSLCVLEELKQDIQAFASAEQSPQAIMGAMNTLFRAILLDGITMLALAGQAALADKLRRIQQELMCIVRTGQNAVLSQVMSISELMAAIDEYMEWILTKL